MSKVLWKNEKKTIKHNHRGLREKLWELVENILVRIKMWKETLYSIESFSLPWPGDVKCDYEEVIKYEQK